MTERYKPLSAEFLAERGECCTRGCINCPYITRHEGGRNVDEDFLRYALENPDLTFLDYTAYLKEKGAKLV